MPHPTSLPLQEAKRLSRARFRTYRRGLDEAAYRALSRTLCNRLRALPEVDAAHVVHAFWPVVERRELDLRPLLRALRAEGRTIVLPFAPPNPAPGEPPRLEHYPLRSEQDLRPNRWGVLEPEPTEPVAPADVDVVLVPSLAVDRSGYRLGYGGGYYDAFLADVAAPRVAPNYAACLVDVLPREAHDVRVDLVVTEFDLLRFDALQPDSSSGVGAQ